MNLTNTVDLQENQRLNQLLISYILHRKSSYVELLYDCVEVNVFLPVQVTSILHRKIIKLHIKISNKINMPQNIPMNLLDLEQNFQSCISKFSDYNCYKNSEQNFQRCISKVLAICSGTKYQHIQYMVKNQSNLMIKHEMFPLLLLTNASLARHSAASCGSSMCLIRFTASWFFITCKISK